MEMLFYLKLSFFLKLWFNLVQINDQGYIYGIQAIKG